MDNTLLLFSIYKDHCTKMWKYGNVYQIYVIFISTNSVKEISCLKVQWLVSNNPLDTQMSEKKRFSMCPLFQNKGVWKKLNLVVNPNSLNRQRYLETLKKS